ncbi:MAG: HlyD family efflux transporter periplasmic adaptor subunit [Anaerolineae bacterium]|nr:HlyD family efflux transporter periplasmic adaptor subunit [Anaerolineae bacterium]
MCRQSIICPLLERDFQAVENGVNQEKLAVAKARLENARALLDSARAGLAELELAAPFAGVVVSNDLKIGEQTGPAAPSPVILADISRWKIMTTDLTERDVIEIHPGDPVAVTFDAIPDLNLSGKVERIKPLGENRQGDITYTVMITLDSLDDRLRWNMTSFVTFEP